MKVVWKTRVLSIIDGASGTIYDATKDKKKSQQKSMDKVFKKQNQ